MRPVAWKHAFVHGPVAASSACSSSAAPDTPPSPHGVAAWHAAPAGCNDDVVDDDVDGEEEGEGEAESSMRQGSCSPCSKVGWVAEDQQGGCGSMRAWEGSASSACKRPPAYHGSSPASIRVRVAACVRGSGTGTSCGRVSAGGKPQIKGRSAARRLALASFSLYTDVSSPEALAAANDVMGVIVLPGWCCFV